MTVSHFPMYTSCSYSSSAVKRMQALNKQRLGAQARANATGGLRTRPRGLSALGGGVQAGDANVSRFVSAVSGATADVVMSSAANRAAAASLVSQSNKVDVFNTNQQATSRAMATSSASPVTDVCFDPYRNILLAATHNRTIRVFNMAKHLVQGPLSLPEIQRRVHVARETREKTRVEWGSIVQHVSEVHGATNAAAVDTEHLSYQVDYGVGISVDKNTALPVLRSFATIGTGPGTPSCLQVRV